MEHIDCVDCRACDSKQRVRPPNKAFIGLIAGFWAASLVLGFLAAQGHGWGIVLAATWAALAASVVLLARRATTWTCAECGSTVAPPVEQTAPPLTGAYRGMHARHA